MLYIEGCILYRFPYKFLYNFKEPLVLCARAQGPSELLIKSLHTLFPRSYTLFPRKYKLFVTNSGHSLKKRPTFWRTNLLKNMPNLEGTCLHQSICNFNDFQIYSGCYFKYLGCELMDLKV